MTDSSDDLDHVSIDITYCKNHKGLWPHECGCSDLEECEHEWECDPELSGDKFVERCVKCGEIRTTGWN